MEMSAHYAKAPAANEYGTSLIYWNISGYGDNIKTSSYVNGPLVRSERTLPVLMIEILGLSVRFGSTTVVVKASETRGKMLLELLKSAQKMQ